MMCYVHLILLFLEADCVPHCCISAIPLEMEHLGASLDWYVSICEAFFGYIQAWMFLLYDFCNPILIECHHTRILLQ